VSRDLSNLSTYLSGETALEMVPIVEINWQGLVGKKKYAKKVITDSLGVAHTMEPLLRNDISLDAVVSAKVFSEIQQVSVTLFDTDGALRILVEDENLEGKPAKVFLGYEGILEGDELTLLSGVVEGPITWNEGTRELSFDIVKTLREIEIPGELDAATLAASPFSDLKNLNDDVEDTWVPMFFGGVLRVPAIQITKQHEAVLDEDIVVHHDTVDGSDPEIPTESTTLRLRASKLGERPFEDFTDGIADVDYLEINGRILEVNFTSWDDDMANFTIVSNNPSKYPDRIQGSANKLLTGTRPLADVDYDNPSVIWLQDTGYIVQGMTCTLHGTTDQHNFCEKQEGVKCWFKDPWTRKEGATGFLRRNPRLIHAGIQVDEIRNFRLDPTLNYSQYFDDPPETLLIFKRGSKVRVWDIKSTLVVSPTQTANADGYDKGFIPEIYLLASQPIDIKSVESVVSRLGHHHEVPYSFATTADRYYEIHEDWQGTDFHALEFPVPLSEYPNESWNDQIFISARSKTGNTKIDGGIDESNEWGNTAEIIRHLLFTWGGGTYIPDLTTFDAVSADVVNYPAGFAVIQKRNLIDLVSEIAWQSRCALRVTGTTVTIIYLSKVPASTVMTLDPDNILEQSFILNPVETQQLVTNLLYHWQESYDEPRKDKRIFENFAAIGNQEAEYDFFIYNFEACADISANWWLHRLSNVWRRYSMSLALEALEVEVFDRVLLDFSGILGGHTEIADANATAEVKDSAYPTAQDIINMTVEIPYIIGSSAIDAGTPNYWAAAALARPDNPATVNEQRFHPLFFDEIVEPHDVVQHQDVDVGRRRTAGGPFATAAEPATTGSQLQDDDVMAWDATDRVWTPAPRGGGVGGGPTTTHQNEIVLILGI
jgi:hypothetical protein